MRDNDASLESYYAFHRASVFINGKDGSTIQNRGIGRVFTEYKDKLLITDGENKRA
jgi:hypothetical protein